MLLTADWHLTDKPADEYRWDVVKSIARIRHPREQLFILGDLTDRKDRHSGELVNRLVDALGGLADAGEVQIIMGNHDAPMRGTPYWELLNRVGRVGFASEPERMSDRLLLLPWSPNPERDWAKIEWPPRGGAIFMHQTVNGALLDAGGRRAQVTNMPVLPRGVKIYSGDIHTPQVVGPLTYVGAPHHVKFGDVHRLRALRLDGRSFEIAEEIELMPPEKRLLEVVSLDDFAEQMSGLQAGAQIRVRMEVRVAQLDRWPAAQREIHQNAAALGIRVDSIEAVMVSSDADQGGFEPLRNAATRGPLEILDAYCAEQSIDPARRRVGQSIIEGLTHG